MSHRPSLLLSALLCLCAPDLRGQEEDEDPPFEYFEEDRDTFEAAAFFDLRLARTDAPESFLDGGFGKTRYGGDTGGNRRTLARISQASFVLDIHPRSDVTAHFQVNLDAEPEFTGGRFGWDRIRPIELFVEWRPSLGDGWELGTKGGLFFPPVSLEHIGDAWSTVYTLTPSAINAWVGEEVKVTGAELSLARVGVESQFSFRGAVFYNNDPTGTLLGYRGFALHGRQTGLRDRLPIPPLPSVLPDGTFSRQAPWVEPVRELDDRPGFYGGAAFEDFQWFRIQALYFDNRGIPTVFDGSQYAWQTRFANLGVVLFLPGGAEVFGQFMDGDTLMGFAPDGPRVAANFGAWYTLVTVPFGRHRASVRYDRFDNEDLDGAFPPFDHGDEEGEAWTFFYNLRVGERHGLAFEVLRVSSDRLARAAAGLSPETDELLLQLSLRLRF